jgi:hypothetical protein
MNGVKWNTMKSIPSHTIQSSYFPSPPIFLSLQSYYSITSDENPQNISMEFDRPIFLNMDSSYSSKVKSLWIQVQIQVSLISLEEVNRDTFMNVLWPINVKCLDLGYYPCT